MKKYLLFTLFISLLLPCAALAQVTFFRDSSLGPLSYTLAPGNTSAGSITIINVGDNDSEVELYATDGTITSTGGYTVLDRSHKQVNIGQWIAFDAEPVLVKAKEKKEVNFTINIPADATPGTYMGGISVTPHLKNQPKLNATGVITTTRVVFPMYIKISGEKVTKFDWTDFTHNYDARHIFTFTLSNKGNTHLKTSGEITITNITGEKYTLPLPSMTLMQKKDEIISIPWEEKPLFGFFTATANIKFLELDLQTNTFTEVGNISKTINFTVIPWTHIIVVLVLITLLIAAIIITKIYSARYLKRCVAYKVAPGDTLTGIAKKNNVNWQKLAKINKLKAPYDLSPGQQILLPPKK
jgi:hypothetical protein